MADLHSFNKFPIETDDNDDGYGDILICVLFLLAILYTEFISRTFLLQAVYDKELINKILPED